MEPAPILIAGPALQAPDATSSELGFEAHKRKPGVAMDSIDGLAAVWETVVDKLSALASSAQERTGRAPYALDTIEFQIGIEAGLNVWLVSKGSASVTLTFKRRDDDSSASG